VTEKKRGLGKNAILMSVGVFFSRLTGLFREQSFAFLFGTSPATQAFVVAFRLPNFFRDILAENIASAAFLPTYVGIREKKGKKESCNFANAVFSMVLTASAAISIIGIFLAFPLCRFIAPGFAEDLSKFNLTVSLTRWLFPFLTLISIAAFFQAIQNAENKFFVPAVSTAVLNIVFIIFGWQLSRITDPPILGMAFGALLGGAATVLFLAPGYLKSIGHIKLINFWRRPDILEMLKLAVPVVIGVSATNVNVLVNTFMASLSEDGAIAFLNFSYRIMHLPLGLIAVSLGTVALPSLSRSFAGDNVSEFRKTLSTSMSYSSRYAIPAAVGLIFLGKEIVEALYGYGRFTSSDIAKTAFALSAYSFGIPAFSLNRILAPAFYARKEPKVPVKFGIVSVCVNIILNLLALYFELGAFGIALSASIAGYLQTFMLAIAMRNRLGRFEGKKLLRQMFAIIAGCVVMSMWFFLSDLFSIHFVILKLSVDIISGTLLYLLSEKIIREQVLSC